LLRQVTLLLLWLGAVSPAALAGPDGDRSATFTVRIEGTQQSAVTRTRRGTDDIGCLVTRSDVDRRTHTFTTARAGTLVVGERGLAGRARIALSVETTGSRVRRNTVSGPGCDGETQTTETTCGPVTIRGNAIVRLPSAGRIGVSGSLTRARDTARCAPATAPDSPFLVSSKGTFDARFLNDPSVRRVVMRGTTKQTARLRSGARRVTSVRWTLVLTRAH
jgi:hypothetical protein